MNRTSFLKNTVFAVALITLPAAAFAGESFKHGDHYHEGRYYNSNSYKSSTDVRPQKQASMTSQELDIAKQREAVPSYNSWSEYRNTRATDARRSYQHHPDAWQGKTAEQKDQWKQLKDADTKRANNNRNERHYPDKWQGLTQDEKDKIKQRNSVRINADADVNRDARTATIRSTTTRDTKAGRYVKHRQDTYQAKPAR